MRIYLNVLGLDNIPRVQPTEVPDTMTGANLAAIIQQQQRGRVLEILNPTEADRQTFDKVPVLDLMNAPLPSTGEQTTGSAPTAPTPQGVETATVVPGMTPLSRLPPIAAGVGTGLGLAAAGVNPLLAGLGAVGAAAIPGAYAGHLIQEHLQPQYPNVPLSERMKQEGKQQAIGEVTGYVGGKVVPGLMREGGSMMTREGQAIEAANTLPRAPIAPVIQPLPERVAGPVLYDAAGNPIASAAEQKGVQALNRVARANAKKESIFQSDKLAYQRAIDQSRLNKPLGLSKGLLGITFNTSHLARPLQAGGRLMSMAPDTMLGRAAGRTLIQSGLRARYSQPPEFTNPEGIPAF